MPAALMIGHHFSNSAFGRGAERLGRKFFARRNFPSQRADSLAHDRLRRGIHDRSLSWAMTSFGTAQSKPKNGSPASRLIHRRDAERLFAVTA
jgi:hypothetical protein